MNLAIPFETSPAIIRFSAKNDFSVDVTASLQRAIDAAVGRILYIPKGYYKLSQTGSTGYCVRIMNPIRIVMDPAAVLMLDTSLANSVAAIQVGDNSAEVSGVVIEGGIIDGNAVDNGGTYSVNGGLIRIVGPVAKVSVRGITLQNGLGAGLLVSGASASSRSKYITVDDCHIARVGEGVRFEKCDHFHMRGGSITDMKSQDCFEPHGALEDWSLRDCYISKPHSSNSAVEIYPQHGDIQGGLIENCTIVDDELRVSLGSGVGAGDYEVRDVTVRGCYFKNSHVYAGVSGKYRNLTIEGCRFEGPSNCPHTVPSAKAGIWTGSANNQINVIKNRISGYQSSGIRIADNDSQIIGNEIFNNAQQASLSTNEKRATLITGNNCLVMGNNIYDTQETPTQNIGLGISGSNHRVIGNYTNGNSAHSTRQTGSDSCAYVGNRGILDKRVAAPTMAAGAQQQDISLTALGITTSSSTVITRTHIQPAGNISPATRYWLETNGVSGMRLKVDAPLASATVFRLFFDFWDTPAT